MSRAKDGEYAIKINKTELVKGCYESVGSGAMYAVLSRLKEAHYLVEEVLGALQTLIDKAEKEGNNT